MTLSFIQGHSCMKKQKVMHSFSQEYLSQFEWNLLCSHDILIWICLSIHRRDLQIGDFFSIQRRELHIADFMKYTFISG